MPESDQKTIKSFVSPKELNEWLNVHHDTKNELWVKVFKKGSGTPSVDWQQIVDEVLCFGWIDSTKKSLSDQSYLQRITPRKSKSVWSKKNTEHIERLICEGRMKEAGLKHVHSAKADGRWENAYSSSKETKLPEDFLETLKSKPKAKQFFETLNTSSRFAIMFQLTNAKRPETRQKRIEKFIGMLEREEKPGFGFQKRTH